MPMFFHIGNQAHDPHRISDIERSCFIDEQAFQGTSSKKIMCRILTKERERLYNCSLQNTNS